MAGFPPYGFKANLSDRAYPGDSAVKPAPGMPAGDMASGQTCPLSKLRKDWAWSAAGQEPAAGDRETDDERDGAMHHTSLPWDVSRGVRSRPPGCSQAFFPHHRLAR